MTAPATSDFILIEPVARPVEGTVTLPGSKSITNRALLIAALADGSSEVRQALDSDDTQAMVDVLQALGIAITTDPAAQVFRVAGQGGRIPAAGADLYCRNSGTTTRFVTALAALGHGRFRIDGTPSIRRRPIHPLLDGLRQLGVAARDEAGNSCPPVIIDAAGLPGGVARVPGDLSSQFFSALLLVAPFAQHDVTVEVIGELVSRPYLDVTASVMAAFGATVTNEDYRRFTIAADQRYTGRVYEVEPDASAASYFFAAAAVTGGRVRVRHLGRRTAQGDLAFVRILEQMGCAVAMADDWTEVRGPARLRGLTVNMADLPDMALTLAAIAPLADGPVRIDGIAVTRGHETDRVSAAATELARLGVRVEERAGGLTIWPGPVRPALVDTYDDHRMAMSFAVLGLRASGIRIADPGCVAKTFPDFFDRLAAVTASAR
ncbi:MAG: 3-phosphoshikimate 1-carboxyvinyltransferase [Chloroflexi bacterium]|nr:3-phosphoshikimate 1-carboxyvinyltransferase [Chloroflexota bacterium]